MVFKEHQVYNVRLPGYFTADKHNSRRKLMKKAATKFFKWGNSMGPHNTNLEIPTMAGPTSRS